MDFFDFFQEIESQCKWLFKDLMYYSSEKHKETNEILIDIIRKSMAIQKDSEREKIIILDEPECHLHPKALISFINQLRNTIGNHVTYWIATHSLFMLPEFEFENIVCIKDSVIQQRSSTTYEKLLSDMPGGKDGKIKTFLTSLTYWQYVEFITKCFTSPEVIETVNSEDEQVKLFIQHLQNNMNQPYRVLDCGGGSADWG